MRRVGEVSGAPSGLAAAVLVGAGYWTLGDLPGPDASDLDVYAFFLDHRGSIRAAAALLIVGVAFLAAFLAVLAAAVDRERRSAAAGAMLACGLLAIAAAAFSAAALGALAVGAENAEPASSRSVLDLADAVRALAGPLFAVALAAAAVALVRAGAARLAALALAASFGCLLWLAPMLTDAGPLAAGSLLGSDLGVVGLVAWIAATALWTHRRRAARAPAQ